MREKEKARKEKKNESRKSKKGEQQDEDIHNFNESKPFQPKIVHNGYSPRKNNMVHDRSNHNGSMGANAQNPPPPPPPPPVSYGNNGNNFQMHQQRGMNMNNLDLEPQNRFNPTLGQPKNNEVNEESLIPDPNCPIKELEYDDEVDHAAEVSVMDSIGGPSLLLENLRNASKIVKTVSPEIIERFGANYPQELGLTREESIQVDANKFYRWVVKNLLETHEPEKIRLIDKLFEKYRGREEHLIHKLNARYTDDDEKSKKAEKSVANGNSEDGNEDNDGFKAFGGGEAFSKPSSAKDKASKYAFSSDGWPTTIGEEGEEEEEANGEPSVDGSEEYSEADYESVDGTSPEVISQVSELLNYVYGKTSVPGQIDRVSTIMRAYEGRTAVLLELLETKALLKANADTENTEDIPASLRSNPGLQHQISNSDDKKDIRIKQSDDGEPVLSPISNVTGGSDSRGRIIRQKDKYLEDSFDDDYENKPINDGFSMGDTRTNLTSAPQSLESFQSSFDRSSPQKSQGMHSSSYSPEDTSNEKKKKKKGFFGMFKKKKGKKDAGGAFPSSDGGFKKNKRGALLG